MTKVILWMWLSDVASSIGAIGIVCLIGLVLGVIFAAISASTEFKEPDRFSIWKRATKPMAWLAVPIAVATVFPSQQTIRLIAATSAINVAADTALGKKAVDAIEAVLTKITKEASK